MKRCWCLLLFLCAVLVRDFVNSTVELILPTLTVTVDEKANRRLDLIDASNPIICRDTDGDLTRAWLVSLTPTIPSPSSPCSKCFTVEPCHVTDPSVYCLVYQAGRDELSFSVASSYKAVINCTDDVEPVIVNASLYINVISNQRPQFNPSGLYGSITLTGIRDKRKGDTLYQVLTKDAENDAVFFDLDTVPHSNLFTICYGSGVIKAARDLRYLCTSTLSFYVTIWDKYHSPGPAKIFQVTFEDINDKPVITTTDHTFQVAEDTAPVTAVGVIEVEDIYLYPDIRLSMTSLTRGALDIYYIIGGKLRVRRALDYEYEPLREVTITIRAFDGFCYSDDYVVRVVITDVNEDFVLQPTFMEPIMFEGFVNYVPNLTIVDQDIGETHTFRKVNGNAKVGVQSSTGLVISTNIFELNIDNCTQVGEIVGKVGGKDDDSALNGNDYLLFSGGGATFAVLADGSVLYTSLLAVGGVDTGSASVTDLGLYPKPLAGVSATVSLSCKVCKSKPTTTGVPTTVTTTQWTGPRNANASEILRATDTSTNARSWHSQNMGWMSAAASLLVLLVVLVALMIWRYAACCRPKPRPRQVKWSKKTARNSGKTTGRSQPQLSEQRQGPHQTQQQTAPLQHQHQQQQLPQAAASMQQNQTEPSPLLQQQQQQQPRSEIATISGGTVDVPMQPPSLPYPVVFQENENKQPARPRDVMSDDKPPLQDIKPSKNKTRLPNSKPPNDTKQPQNNKPSKDNNRPQNNKPSKNANQPINFKPTMYKMDKGDKIKAEEDPAGPGEYKAEEDPQSLSEETYQKPQMEKGDYIDLEIITPRNSPLPGHDK